MNDLIQEQIRNSRGYYALHGRPLTVLPAAAEDRPSRSFITYHNEQVFAP